MATIDGKTGLETRPAHVPADRVVDFDYFSPPGIEQGDVYTAWKRLHDGPDIIWTPSTTPSETARTNASVRPWPVRN